MTPEEYKHKIEELYRQVDKERRALSIAFAIEHCPAKIGDLIEDHISKILYESHSFYYDHGLPKTIFIGPRLKANLTPYKNGEKATVYQHNIKKINGVPV